MSSSQDDEIAFRQAGIAACIDWIRTLDPTSPRCATWMDNLVETVQFQAPSTALDYGGLGIFTKRDLDVGDVVLQIPSAAGFGLSQTHHFGPDKSPHIYEFSQNCRKTLLELVLKHQDRVPPYDRYAKVRGRVFLNNYMVLACVTALVLLQDDIQNQSASQEDNNNHIPDRGTLLQEIREKLATTPLWTEVSQTHSVWASFFATLPRDWSHLPWTWKELSGNTLGLQGTTFGALAQRMQLEVHQVYEHVFLPTILTQFGGVSNGADDKSSLSLWSPLLFDVFERALALVHSHSHTITDDDQNNMVSSGSAFVEPVPIIFPIIDLANGSREGATDCNATLMGQGKSYMIQTTRTVKAGEELILDYGPEALPNLEFFVKFGYIPLEKSSNDPILVSEDFVTLPVAPSLRPKGEADSGATVTKGKKSSQQQSNISKLDQLRWQELSRNGLGKDRLIEPIDAFQRAIFLSGNLETIRKFRNDTLGGTPEFIDRLERFVMTMLASKTALTKLAQGKMPPPPVLQPWEPGKYMVQLLDYYLKEHTTLLVKEEPPQPTDAIPAITVSEATNKKSLATQACKVERDIICLWRHAIATHHKLYFTEAAGVERLTLGDNKLSHCVTCRTQLHVSPCANCGTVSYCSESCRAWDWEQGHGRICALLAARSKPKGDPASF